MDRKLGYGYPGVVVVEMQFVSGIGGAGPIEGCGLWHVLDWACATSLVRYGKSTSLLKS